MALPDDLSLPTPPPPNPSRREAALAAGVSRFDARHGQAAAPLTPAPQEPVKRWAGLARPQLAAFATVSLVAMVSVPLWIERNPPSTETAAPPPPNVAFEPQADAVTTQAVPVTRMEVAPPVPDQRNALGKSASPSPAAIAAPSERGDTEAKDKLAQKSELGGLVAPAQQRAVVAAAPPPPPPPATPPPAMAPSASGKAALSEDSSIVVTGNRVQDSDEADERVRRESREDVRQRSADNAISALDRKIEQAPGDADAYLRRGEQWRRKGDLGRALADLDRAVRLAPRSARAYYERSLVLRRLGQTDRAEADERRAILLDRRYDAIIP